MNLVSKCFKLSLYLTFTLCFLSACKTNNSTLNDKFKLRYEVVKNPYDSFPSLYKELRILKDSNVISFYGEVVEKAKKDSILEFIEYNGNTQTAILKLSNSDDFYPYDFTFYTDTIKSFNKLTDTI
jgi:hypothetical protein